jgi:hypothetical protein
VTIAASRARSSRILRCFLQRRICRSLIAKLAISKADNYYLPGSFRFADHAKGPPRISRLRARDPKPLSGILDIRVCEHLACARILDLEVSSRASPLAVTRRGGLPSIPRDRLELASQKKRIDTRGSTPIAQTISRFLRDALPFTALCLSASRSKSAPEIREAREKRRNKFDKCASARVLDPPRVRCIFATIARARAAVGRCKLCTDNSTR